MATVERNPFRVGDEVVFVPDARAIGWHQHSFDRWGVYPGYVGRVSKVDGLYLILDGKELAAMHWAQFRYASQVSLEERERLESSWRLQNRRNS